MRIKLIVLGALISMGLHSAAWAQSQHFGFKSCGRYDSALDFMRETSAVCAKQSAQQSCEEAAKRQFKVCGFSNNLSNSERNRLKELMMLVLISGSHGSTRVALRK